MKCPTCDGTGEVPDPEPIERDMELYCEAEVIVDGDQTVGCLIKGPPHEGPHNGKTTAPCRACGGLETHVDWCSILEDIDARRAEGGVWIEIVFDDDGWYWVEPPKVAIPR